MSQRSVFGYFQTMEQAQKAEKELQSQGYKEVSIDRFSPLLGGNPYDLDDEIHGIFHRQGNSLATTTLGTPDTVGDNKQILATSHVDASGQSGGTGFTHPEDICVTVITDEEGYQTAESILKEYGARD